MAIILLFTIIYLVLCYYLCFTREFLNRADFNLRVLTVGYILLGVVLMLFIPRSELIIVDKDSIVRTSNGETTYEYTVKTEKNFVNNWIYFKQLSDGAVILSKEDLKVGTKLPKNFDYQLK